MRGRGERRRGRERVGEGARGWGQLLGEEGRVIGPKNRGDKKTLASVRIGGGTSGWGSQKNRGEVLKN